MWFGGMCLCGSFTGSGSVCPRNVEVILQSHEDLGIQTEAMPPRWMLVNALRERQRDNVTAGGAKSAQG